MSERPLRIAFVAYRGNMRSGGQGIYLWHLARELTRAGHRVDVFVGPPWPDPMPFAGEVVRLEDGQYWAKWFLRERLGFLPEPFWRVFHPLAFWELGASWIGFLPEPAAQSWRAFAALARRGRRWDLVHDVQCLGWGLLALRALGLPVVTTVHHPLSVDRRSSFARDRTLTERVGTAKFYPLGMQAFVARRLDAVITSSHASRRLIERDFGVAPARLHELGNGLDTHFFAPEPEPGARRSASELLCVGRAADPNKGVSTLLAALARLPQPVRLTLVDDDGPGAPARRLAREAGVSARVDIVGRVSRDQLRDLYRRAALVVVPSLYEGFGLPAAEAMACGTPVVASAAGALPEVVGDAAIQVAPGQAEPLAKAIASLLEQPEARARLALRGRERIQARFAWPAVAARTVDVYRSVLASA